MAQARHVPLASAVAALPGPPTEKWTAGVFDQEFFRKKGVSASIFAPRGEDFQTPHEEDELYLIVTGSGDLEIGDQTVRFAPGDLIYVPAGLSHRFTGPLDDLVAWVIFLPA